MFFHEINYRKQRETVDPVAVFECLVVGEVVMHLHEDDVEGGEGGGQPDDVEDGGDHLGFGFLDDSHNGKSTAANPIQQPCQTVKSLTLSRIQYEYRKKRKHPLQQCKDSLHTLFFTIEINIQMACCPIHPKLAAHR